MSHCVGPCIEFVHDNLLDYYSQIENKQVEHAASHLGNRKLGHKIGLLIFNIGLLKWRFRR